MTILTRVHARVFNYGRDINGNRIAHFAILDTATSRELYVTKRRQQVGIACRDQQAVTRFLEGFEGGEWNRTTVIDQPSGDVLATYERDLERAYRLAAVISTEAAAIYLAAQSPAEKAAASARWNEHHLEVHRIGLALNQAEACAERRKA